MTVNEYTELENEYRRRVMIEAEALAGFGRFSSRPIADALGLSRSTVDKWLGGTRGSAEIPKAAARVFGGWFERHLAELLDAKRLSNSNVRGAAIKAVWNKRRGNDGPERFIPDLSWHYPSPHPQPAEAWRR